LEGFSVDLQVSGLYHQLKQRALTQDFTHAPAFLFVSQLRYIQDPWLVFLAHRYYYILKFSAADVFVVDRSVPCGTRNFAIKVLARLKKKIPTIIEEALQLQL